MKLPRRRGGMKSSACSRGSRQKEAENCGGFFFCNTSTRQPPLLFHSKVRSQSGRPSLFSGGGCEHSAPWIRRERFEGLYRYIAPFSRRRGGPLPSKLIVSPHAKGEERMWRERRENGEERGKKGYFRSSSRPIDSISPTSFHPLRTGMNACMQDKRAISSFSSFGQPTYGFMDGERAKETVFNFLCGPVCFCLLYFFQGSAAYFSKR